MSMICAMDEQFFIDLPKLELHAHLAGSVSLNIMKKLFVENGSGEAPPPFQDILDGKKGLDDCFEMFNVIHDLLKTPSAIFLATKEVIREFSEDGVVYLELRTTPRREKNMTKKKYIDSVLLGIEQCADLPIMVKLLISLDREQSYCENKENLELAIKYRKSHPNYVVGIDVSGNPFKGNWCRQLVERARAESDLMITIHCGEVPGIDEIWHILNFKPDRIGHGTCILPNNGGSDFIWNTLLNFEIPVEICLTSNIRCGTVNGYSEHHLRDLLYRKHPYVISTDDKGIFQTSLSREYGIACEVFEMTREQIEDDMLRSIDFLFCSMSDKHIVYNIVKKFFQKFIRND